MDSSISFLLHKFALVFLCVGFLTSCGKVSKDYADKINKAADAEKYMTYEQISKDLGTDYSGQIVDVLGGGVLTWTTKKGETTSTLAVTFNKDRQATGALFHSTTSSDDTK
jgi:hypothetical protein